MTRRKAAKSPDPEIAAISVVHNALQHLESDSQQRVLDYVAGKLGLAQPEIQRDERPGDNDRVVDLGGAASQREPRREDTSDSDDLEGISPVAIRWMRRNSLTADELAKVFSLGVEEIDLVADTVPGRNKKDRMHSVLLLKGIAAYLGTGAPRVSHEQVKEACLHYDAFDSTNFAKYFASFASEVTGSKESGHTLTARGLTVGTEVLKGMLRAGSKD